MTEGLTPLTASADSPLWRSEGGPALFLSRSGGGVDGPHRACWAWMWWGWGALVRSSHSLLPGAQTPPQRQLRPSEGSGTSYPSPSPHPQAWTPHSCNTAHTQAHSPHSQPPGGQLSHPDAPGEGQEEVGWPLGHCRGSGAGSVFSSPKGRPGWADGAQVGEPSPLSRLDRTLLVAWGVCRGRPTAGHTVGPRRGRRLV